MRKKFTIYAALLEETKAGWIWIPKTNDIKSDLIKVTNPVKKKTIVCECRVIDDNFIDDYNKRRTKRIKKNEMNNIVVSEYYRNKLGDIKTEQQVELIVEESGNGIKGYIDRYLNAPFNHPDVYVRITARVAVWSLFLGGLALFFALLTIGK